MTKVIPEVGCYQVQIVDPNGVRTHLVGKDKHCTCGGSAERWCSHIHAVAAHLRGGGERAPKGDGSDSVHDSNPVPTGNGRLPDSCPICGAPVAHLNPGAWRCKDDSAHYFQWRGEQNGGAIRKFLTRPHPAKQGAFYTMTTQERQIFLLRALQRMHRLNYIPHNGKDHSQ